MTTVIIFITIINVITIRTIITVTIIVTFTINKTINVIKAVAFATAITINIALATARTVSHYQFFHCNLDAYYTGYQRFFLACDKELRHVYGEKSSGTERVDLSC